MPPKIIPIQQCTVKGCQERRMDSDRLFCVPHRDKWIEFCKDNEVHNKEISEAQEIFLLAAYQGTAMEEKDGRKADN